MGEIEFPLRNSIERTIMGLQSPAKVNDEILNFSTGAEETLRELVFGAKKLESQIPFSKNQQKSSANDMLTSLREAYDDFRKIASNLNTRN